MEDDTNMVSMDRETPLLHANYRSSRAFIEYFPRPVVLRQTKPMDVPAQETTLLQNSFVSSEDQKHKS